MSTHTILRAPRALLMAVALGLAGCSTAPLERRLTAMEGEHAALAHSHARQQAQMRELSIRLAQAQAVAQQLDDAMRSYSTMNAAQIAQTQTALGRLEAELRKAQADAREATGVVSRFRILTTDSGMKVVVAE